LRPAPPARPLHGPVAFQRHQQRNHRFSAARFFETRESVFDGYYQLVVAFKKQQQRDKRRKSIVVVQNV
jgi:hypothetical protein